MENNIMQTVNIKLFWKATLSQIKPNIKTLNYHERLHYKKYQEHIKIYHYIWYLVM